MKYWKIFKSWWFYLLIIAYSLFSIVRGLNTYGHLYGVEYIGIILGSFLGVWFMTTLIYGISKLISNIKKKVTKR